MKIFKATKRRSVGSLIMQLRLKSRAKIVAMLAAALALAGMATPSLAQLSQDQLAEHQRAAQQAEASGDFVSAIREYELLAHALPGNGSVQSNLGVALYFHHDLEKAAEVFQEAILLDKNLYTPHLFLGLTSVKLSRPDQAVAELKRAIAINGNDPLAHTWLGFAYTAQGRYKDAAEQLQTAGQEVPKNLDVAYALGKCYLALGKTAIAHLFEVAPDGGRTWQLAGEQFEVQGNSGKALRAYLGALERRPDLVDLQAKITALGGTAPVSSGKAAEVNTGRNAREDAAYEEARRYEQEAREAFERVSQIDPDSYRAHQVQADSDIAADRTDEAVREYKIALEKNPDVTEIHGALCDALSRMDHVQDALKECKMEISEAPFDAEGYVDETRVFLQMGDDTQAVLALEQALKLDRPPITAYRLEGRLYLSQGKYQAAAKALKTYLASETKDSKAYYLLARACKYSGDTQGMNAAMAAYKRTSEAFRNVSYAEQALSPKRDEDDTPDDGNKKEP
ncbi:MAG TPA: tetratricopeptide repeat protein [Terracidiphilus sp.]